MTPAAGRSSWRFLLDENLSPRLAERLHARGHFAEHVAHRGLSGHDDPEVWAHAFRHDEVVVTINARDFLTLAASSELHAGLIVLRSEGLTRDEQWTWLAAAVSYLETHPADHLVNRVVEIAAPGPRGFLERALPVA